MLAELWLLEEVIPYADLTPEEKQERRAAADKEGRERFANLPPDEAKAVSELEAGLSKLIAGYGPHQFLKLSPEDQDALVEEYLSIPTSIGRLARSADRRVKVPYERVDRTPEEQGCIDLAETWASTRGIDLYRLETRSREDLCLLLRGQGVKQSVVGWLLGCHIAGGKARTDEYVRQLTRRAEKRRDGVGGAVA